MSEYSSFFEEHSPLSSLSFNVYSQLTNILGKVDKKDLENLEIEFKFGSILNKMTKRRINIPISSPAIVSFTEEYFFESSIPGHSYKIANSLFNSYFCRLCDSGCQAKYSHEKLTDKFYKSDFGKIRTTYKDGECRSIINKKNLLHIHLFYPNAQYDVRLSLNIENSFENRYMENSSCIFTRYKDRLSYMFPNFATVDLTMVKKSDSEQPVFELEIEIESANFGSEPFINAINMIDWVQSSFL